MQPSRLALDRPNGGSVVAVGVIDSHTAAELTAMLDECGAGADVTVNLAAVEFIDSSGLRAVLNAHQSLEEHGHKLRLASVSQPVRRLLEITGLDKHLHLVE